MPELIKLKKAKVSAADSVPSAAERYASHLDERPPTPTFTETDLELAVSIFNHGRMSPPVMFDDLTKEFLLLPLSQNKALTKSVHLEKFLYKFKRDKFFSHIFLYVEQMAKIAKHLRITEQPVILAMGEHIHFMNMVRTSGKDLASSIWTRRHLCSSWDPGKSGMSSPTGSFLLFLCLCLLLTFS